MLTPGAPVIVTTVTKGGNETAEGGVEEAEVSVEVDKNVDDGAVEGGDEAEGEAPEDPPAASDSCAKPIEGGVDLKTE